MTSRPGHGTRFEILLPREGSIASPSAGASSEETRASLGNATLREATIILAEDQEMVRRMVEGALTRAGARVVSAGSAEAALALAEREGRPDLVLTDIGLPGMGGRQLGERMSALYPGVPLVFMSAYTEDTVLQRGVRARDVRFLQKPFSPSSLLEALSRALSDDGDASAHPPSSRGRYRLSFRRFPRLSVT